jgi:hypothetical protein
MKQGVSNRAIFWMIILGSVSFLVVISGVVFGYQVLNQQAQATASAIPIMTAEALEARYQKGIANINIGRSI